MSYKFSFSEYIFNRFCIPSNIYNSLRASITIQYNYKHNNISCIGTAERKYRSSNEKTIVNKIFYTKL